jgi:pyruvate formate-lyase/glycerol dehydratase family glycyl radical enzyme
MKTRIEKLRRTTIEAQPSICGERGRIVTESFRATQGEPQVIRRAIAFKDILEQMSIVIDPDELIVGNQASRINAAPLFPEFSIDFLLDEIDVFAKRPYDRFEIDAETKETIREIAPFWKGQTHEDRVVHTTRRFFPVELLVAWEEDKFRLNDILYNGVRKSAGDGHIIPDYFNMMVGGIPGVIREAKLTLSELNYQKDSDAFQKKLFLDAVVISYEAIQHWFLRYSELAESLSATDLSENTESLLSVAQTCRNLAQTAPADFHEAIQLTYFIHLLLHIESNGHSISLGRVDQYLYPFYRRDIDGGVLTDEQVLELIDCLYIKISKFNKVRPWPETRLKSGAPMFMTLTLGGQTRDGKDAVNELTYRFLDALGDTRLPQPTPVVRVCSTTSNDLLIHSAQVLLRHGGGLPAFFSDEIIIPALMKMGIPQADAREYGIGGCSEAVIPGKTFSFTGGDCYFNFLKILEVLLNEGVNPRTGICLFPAKKLEEYDGIDDILVEFQRHLAKYMSYIVPLTAITSATDADLNPTPFSSGLLDYRIEMGKDMSFGGGKNALYSHTILQGHGTGDICNSLYALEQLVFKNKELTLREFSDVLRSNWEGERGLELQNRTRHIFKYGNDIDEVDRYAVQVSNMFAEEASKYTPWRGGKFGVSLQGLTANVPEGETVGATPDGREAHEALSDNISPHAGTDLNGPTSTLKSVSKVDHSLFVDGNILNLRFHPSVLLNSFGEFDDQRGKRFANMIKTYLVDLKGNQVQFNVLSSNELRQAQEKPEKYRDLIVKVAGYSAYFNSLDKGLQDQIIKRTEHMF